MSDTANATWATQTREQIRRDILRALGRLTAPETFAEKYPHIKIRLRFRVRAYRVLRRKSRKVLPYWNRRAGQWLPVKHRARPRRTYIKGRFDPTNPF